MLGERWNISLFHYRNHGSAWGRVLVGFQVPKGEARALRDSLATTGYRFWEGRRIRRTSASSRSEAPCERIQIVRKRRRS